MRILHVTHELPPYELAGTAIYSLNIARAQAREHDVFIFARLQDPEQEDYRLHTEHRDGCTIQFMNRADLEWSPFESSYRDRRAQRIFRDFIEEVQPDIVHFQHVLGIGAGALDVVRKLGLPSVFTLHDFWSMCPMGQRMCYTDDTICDPIDFTKCGPCVFGDGWRDMGPREAESLRESRNGSNGNRRRGLASYYRRRVAETPGRFARRPRALLRAAGFAARDLLRKGGGGTKDLPYTENPFIHRFNALRKTLMAVDLLITPSAFLRDEYIEKCDIPPARIIHSANGMDFSYVHALPKTPSTSLRFGFLGSIIPTKGVAVLLDAFLETATTCDDIRLEIHGAPNRWTEGYRDALQQKAAGALSSDRITFHGRYDNQRVGEVLQGIDVLVVPSIWFENAPLTLNEAAMTGTPIVVSDRGGMLEFVRANGYGRTFELGNPRSLAAVMKEIAKDRSLVPSLAGSPPPIKSVRHNADELTGIYAALLAGTYDPPTLADQARTRGGCV